MKCECGEKAEFFHSKCCGAHFEGVIKNGEFQVVCEKCGSSNMQKLFSGFSVGRSNQERNSCPTGTCGLS